MERWYKHHFHFRWCHERACSVDIYVHQVIDQTKLHLHTSCPTYIHCGRGISTNETGTKGLIYFQSVMLEPGSFYSTGNDNTKGIPPNLEPALQGVMFVATVKCLSDISTINPLPKVAKLVRNYITKQNRRYRRCRTEEWVRENSMWMEAQREMRN